MDKAAGTGTLTGDLTVRHHKGTGHCTTGCRHCVQCGLDIPINMVCDFTEIGPICRECIMERETKF